MTELVRPGEALVRRSLDDRHNLLVARADFAQMFAGYLDHVRRWETEPDGLALTMMRQGLAAGALHLACSPKESMVGWTINLLRPPLNLFLTGQAGERTITGRVFTENVRTARASRMFVETRTPSNAITQSTIEVDGFDVLSFFEQFYNRSEQKPARFFEASDSEFVMLLGLPGIDAQAMQKLTREEGIALADSAPRPLDERIFRFQCGCNFETMREVVGTLFREKEDELFRGEAEVEVFCPRCGHRWRVTKKDVAGF
jgi:molecular chaperone Hsp33